MTTEERDLIASAYDAGTLRVIVATCSLAAGINLPARRVILHGARMGRDLINPAMLRQMRGRAGRKGKDDMGESYVCCQRADLEEVSALLDAELPPAESTLTTDVKGLKRAILEIIAIRLATHEHAVQAYISHTLLARSGLPSDQLTRMTSESISTLQDEGLIKIDGQGGYQACSLGQAIVASSLAPEDGIFVYGELRRALQSFVMDGEMHIFYTFTPVWNPGNVEIQWAIFRREVENLDESGLRVVKLVGINPAVVNRL